MQVTTSFSSPTEAKLLISLEQSDLGPVKAAVLQQMGMSLKLPGFRPGTAPLALIEKNVDQNQLQATVAEAAIETYYPKAVADQKLRPVLMPAITLQKFVPFDQLVFEAKVEVVGTVKLANYRAIKKPKKTVEVTDKDVEDVINSLRDRLATREPVQRAAKPGDEAVIDFNGRDDKGKPVNGADAKHYPLRLGSKTFIPGFEEKIVGMKPGEQKVFTISFPKDYAVGALRKKKVTFEVTVHTVHEMKKPKLDSAFARQAGPFKTMAELRADIRRQLAHEKKHEADRQFESELIEEIVKKSTLTVPQGLVDEQIERLMQDVRQNLAYRGQTYQEYLAAMEKSEAEHRKELQQQAAERVKGGLILAEIADAERVEVTPEELEIRMQVLKSQYRDEAMQAELNKPETRREIASRLLTEKTVAKIVAYATGESSS